MALDHKDSASRRKTPRAAVELHARALGLVEWVCPHCYRFQKTRVNWRRPRHRCTNNACCRVSRFGLAAQETEYSVAVPWNAQLDEYRGDAVNKLNPQDAVDWTGAVVGTLEWWCHHCGTRNLASPSAIDGETKCVKCRKSLHWALIIYTAVAGAHLTTPADWIPPVGGDLP